MFGNKDKNKKLKIKKEPTLWDTMKNDTMKNKTKKQKYTALEKAMKEA